MQARLNIAKKVCINTYKSINRLFLTKNSEYLKKISQKNHIAHHSKLMIDEINQSYTDDVKNYIFSKDVTFDRDKFSWILNPIDNIDNYIKMDQCFTTSIAICKDNIISASVIINHDTGYLVSSIRGEGSLYENKKLRCNEYEDKYIYSTNILELNKQFHSTTYDLQTSGAVMTDILKIAQGEIDFGIYDNINFFEIAAGILICKESGFIVSNFSGDEISYGSESLIICQPSSHKNILRYLEDYS